jgi:ParB-like chromosome segregation protein Spo0J
MTQRIRLDAIAFDAGTQIRAALDQQVVADYVEAMSNGAVFPPIVLFHDGNQHYLADGFHRFMAAQRLTFVDIDADVRPGSREDALWFALGANKTNGKRLNEADKTHAVDIALRAWPAKMQREIAEQVGCSESLVSKVAKDIAKNTSGEPDIRGRALATKTKRDAVREMVLAGKQSIDIKQKLNVHSGVIAEVRRELGLSSIDYSRAAVKARRQQMRDMAAAGHTSRQIATELGLSEPGCREILRAEGIDVPADRAVGHIKRHDSNRIIAQIVMDAEHLTEGVNLVDFASLDRSQLPAWLKSLQASRDTLGAFIRKLMKEQQNHGEAA